MFEKQFPIKIYVVSTSTFTDRYLYIALTYLLGQSCGRFLQHIFKTQNYPHDIASVIEVSCHTGMMFSNTKTKCTFKMY